MAKKFLVAIDLAKNELQNAVVQSLGSAPGSPVKFQLYGNSSDNTLYWWDGAQWIAAKAAAGATPAATVTTQAVGDSPVVGVSTNFAREDHKHGREAFGTITAETNFGTSSANGSAATIARSDHTHGNPPHNDAAHSAITLSVLAAPTFDRTMGGFKITGLGTPISGTDAVTKDYADNLAAGLAWKDACRAATVGNITLSGTQTIDGVSMNFGERCLVKDQSTGSQNGIYTVNSGAWIRATDADAVGELDAATVFIMEGTVNADKAYTCTTNGPITPGTTATTWVLFGAGTSYSGGAGLTLTGSTFDVVAANASIVVGADNVGVGFAGTGGSFGSNDTVARSNHDHAGIYAPVAHNHDGIYTKKFAAACAAATTTAVAHNLNTRDVLVEVYRNATPWDSIECDVERTDVNTVTVRFATAPAAGDYRIVVAA